MAQEYFKNDVISKGFISANQLLSAGVDLQDIFVDNTELRLSIISLSSQYLSLTGGELTGNLVLTGTVIADSFNSPGPSLIAFDTATISATPVVYLPINANDIELTGSSPTTIISFMGGVKGCLYTITNKSTDTIYISAGSTIFFKKHPVEISHLFTPQQLNTFVLPANTSCSLRADEDERVSIW
jgi:hypothetical protein